MCKQRMKGKAATTLEIKIVLIYLKNSGWAEEICEWQDFLQENHDDYIEYREWYMAYCV